MVWFPDTRYESNNKKVKGFFLTADFNLPETSLTFNNIFNAGVTALRISSSSSSDKSSKNSTSSSKTSNTRESKRESANLSGAWNTADYQDEGEHKGGDNDYSDGTVSFDVDFQTAAFTPDKGSSSAALVGGIKGRKVVSLRKRSGNNEKQETTTTTTTAAAAAAAGGGGGGGGGGINAN